ncbi:MAG: hydantoinase/oxoprolinase family protein [Thermomicrobium sp.]|nr:hydantoinase/oxoprolinase family protein [Thermomicrobium sp.]
MIRIGIDVGGTFTKAVAVDLGSGEPIARVAVPTTHRAQQGVAAGAIEALQRLLATARFAAADVRLVTFSTTQAVNALLEGDVVPVGILALGPRRERRQTQQRTRLERIELAPGRALRLHYAYVDLEEASEAVLERALQELTAAGAGAIAISAAYAVENPAVEERALAVARRLGVPATAGHQLTGLYGLEVRTLTAAINASILPRMRETTAWVKAALDQSGIGAPAMVLTGDLSVVPIDQLADLPAPSMLSGPAASVAGALRTNPTVDALFVEVGGTSTNIGVIRNGRPALRYVRIMRHPTCLRSVDVHVAGIGGGSLIRIERNRVVGVGPRSAHIAGLPYVSFAADLGQPSAWETVAPREGDDESYVVIRDAHGRPAALTLTDAANALGLLPSTDYACGDRARARAAFEVVARALGRTADDLAREVLDAACAALEPLARDLLREYELRQPPVIGLGGGAGVIAPLLAERLGLRTAIAPAAEVIAAIGAATTPLSLIEEVHVRSGPELLAAVERVERRLVAFGATRGSVQVVVEPIPERQASRIRALALETHRSADLRPSIDRETAHELAARALGVPATSVRLQFENPYYWVFTASVRTGIGPFRRERRPIVVIDRHGSVCFHAVDGSCRALSGTETSNTRQPSQGCACAIIGARCLLLDRPVDIDQALASGEGGCLLVGQPARL